MEIFIKYIVVWFIFLGISYYLARKEYKSYYYFWMYWEQYTEETFLGGLFAAMKALTIFIPLVCLGIYLCYLFIYKT